MAGETDLANEAELMRACGNLYASIALESLATTLMSCAFAYLLLLITNKGRLTTPGKAAFIFVKKQVGGFCREVWEEMRSWPQMKGLPVDRRFGLCRKTNQAVCTSQLLIGFLTIQRWLHIRNINGFRYLGYSLTCPPMQAELIILIAPVVPCYRLQVVFTYIMTGLELWAGYLASVVSGNLYEGDLEKFVGSWSFGDLKPTNKFFLAAFAATVQIYLTFVQIPYLALLYVCRGGVRAGLPYGYLRLLFIVAVSWLAFPVWWAVSYEGMSLLTDTKLNAAGFALLNVISKGLFTLQMLSMSKWHVVQKKREDCIQKGLRHNGISVSLFHDHDEPAPVGAPAEPVVLSESSSSRPRRKELKRKETFVVTMLRPYDKVPEPPESWLGLDPTCRAFLVGRGMSPSIWRSLGHAEQQQLKEEYEITLDIVTGEQSLRTGHPSRVQLPQGADPSQAAARTDQQPPQVGVRKGQMLTTLEGLQGRVLEVRGKEVHIQEAPGKEPVVVAFTDLTSLKVHFLGARGLQDADPSHTKQLYCSCMADGRPTSEVFTEQCEWTASKVSWERDVELYGFCLGDALLLRLWGKDASEAKPDELLGEAKIAGTALSIEGFEGEFQLAIDGRGLRTHLSVTMVPQNLPRESR